MGMEINGTVRKDFANVTGLPGNLKPLGQRRPDNLKPLGQRRRAGAVAPMVPAHTLARHNAKQHTTRHTWPSPRVSAGGASEGVAGYWSAAAAGRRPAAPSVVPPANTRFNIWKEGRGGGGGH